MSEGIKRRLAAILAADVVGYSSLMGEDEAGTLAALRKWRSELFGPTVADHRGNIAKSMGDGWLVEFDSAVDAVTCAIQIQEKLSGHEILKLRIGLHIGDITHADDDIFGDGVNIAARLQEIAEPGAIVISDMTRRSVDGKLAAHFSDLGQLVLKNIADPVTAYGWGMTAVRVAAEPLQLPDKPSIAVLPFDNMSGDPEQEYFSDGLAEDIITALSHWHSFPVIARNSSFSFKGRHVRIDKIAEELGARYVLEGSVRKSRDRLRITAQLIDSQTGHHVWAERFDRQHEDIFDIQDEITNRIAATIMPEIEHFEHKRSKVKRTEYLDAWDFYLRGMERFHDETCEGILASIRMFQSSVELDPNYSDAWSRLGWCHALLVMRNCNENPEASLKNGFNAARKAVALDDGSALAHMSLGTVYVQNKETALGLAEAQIALQLNPNLAVIALAVGNRLDLMGKTDEGITQIERSLTLNPRDPNLWRYMGYLSRAYISKGDNQSAADWAREAVLLRPDLPEALFRCAVCVAHLGELDEARALLDRCTAIDPTFLTTKADWQPYADQEKNLHLLSGLRHHKLFP